MQPIVIAVGRNHYPCKDASERLAVTQMAVWIMEKLRTLGSADGSKFVALVDMRGWKLSQADWPLVKPAASILQTSYPEHIGRAFIIGAPW